MDHRDKTGEGQYLDFSQFETAVYFVAPGVLDYAANGREPQRIGNASEYAAPHGVYQCQGDDRWCTIAVFNDEEWEILCQEMGKPELATDPRFDTLLNRKKNEKELNALISEWAADRTPEAVMEQLQAAGVPAGVVKNTADMYVDPQVNSRGMYWKMDHPEVGEFTHLGQSFIMSETPGRPYRPSPLIGEHTQQICSEILGMSDEEFVNLMAQGVFE
jgi:benzylsuccinate CoA-transferase BbsF subunit